MTTGIDRAAYQPGTPDILMGGSFMSAPASPSARDRSSSQLDFSFARRQPNSSMGRVLYICGRALLPRGDQLLQRG